MRKLKELLVIALVCLAGGAGALTVQVDPVGGTDNGVSPFGTLDAALVAVVGADAGPDIINVRSNGNHVLSAELAITVAAADGELTIQRDPGDGGNAVIVLANVNPGLSVAADGGSTVSLIDLTIIPPYLSAGTANATTSSDGCRFTNATGNGTGVATINITGCILGANDGSNAVVSFDLNPASSTVITGIGDDWLDFFPNTVGNLTDVIVSHAGDEAVLLRGDNNGAPALGADVSVSGRSIFSYNAGRTFQAIFGGNTSGDDSEPTLTVTGTLADRIRIYRNGLNWSGNGTTAFGEAEATVRAFDGNINFQFVDLVENGGAAFVVDTDDADSFNLDCARIAENGAADHDNSGLPDLPDGIIFQFPTDHLTTATITRTTLHNNDGNEFRISDTTSSTYLFQDCIFTGENDNDRIEVTAGSLAAVTVSNSAIVTLDPYKLAPGPIAGEPITQLSTISASPDYISRTFDVTDSQNANFLRATRRSPLYDTAGTGSTELRGGNCLSVVDPAAAVSLPWLEYE